jgi:hypothetical protein
MEYGIGIIFILVGLAALIGSVCLIRSSIFKQRVWRKTIGVVTGYQESRRDNQVNYRPEVKFTDDSGKQHVFATSTGSQKCLHKVGDSLAVLFNPDAPENATVNSFSDLYAAATIIALLAVGFLGIGIASLLK